MKNVKKVLVALLLVASLAGCSSKKTETKQAYCKGSENQAAAGYNVNHDYQFEYQGDKVTKEVITIETTFTDASYLTDGALSEDVKALLDETVAATQKSLESTDGITYEVKYDGDKSIETYTIDFSKASNDALVTIGLLSESDKDAKFISMDQTIKNLEGTGFNCEKAK